MAFGDQDISIFFADGDLCLVTDTRKSAKVHLNWPEEISNFGGMSKPGMNQGKPVMEFATGSLGDLPHGTEVQIRGRKFTIAYVRKTGDGLTSEADLNKAK